ncbi:MAG: ATP-binding protein [Lachnospiraceae bacterium]|nr:ATP-binding protein [Lachnospiraceae bacterium]
MDYKTLPLPVGVDDYEKLITRGYYFIDKTLFIKELLDKKGDVHLFTRPRRFGKTLSLSILQYFFEDARDRKGEKKDNRYLFEGKKIMQAGEMYLSYMGQYPVISLSLKSGKQPDFRMAYASLVDEIQKEYDRHIYVLQEEAMTPAKKEKYESIMNGTAKGIDYSKALEFLSKCLEMVHGKKAIILIDEYDVPLENAFMEGFYEEMIGFIRSLFESALKTNSSLEFAVIMGCLRISKESIFTGMNNLNIISILNNNFGEYFGFTDEEVRRICYDYDMPGKYDVFKKWYKGYLFGNANVYNPWSVIKLMYDLIGDVNCLPSSYWANTSSNSIVRSLIEMADEDTKKEIEALIEGGTITKPVHENITYDEIYKTMDNLWNFLFFTGYLKKGKLWMDEKTSRQYVELTIPNAEVKYIFRTKVLSWFDEKVHAKDRTELFQAVISHDAEKMEEEIGELLMETISFNDAYESFYHGFLAGILSGMKWYTVKSNREGGRGRSDLFIKPVSRRKAAYVVEFKIAGNIRELEKKAEEAIQQIEDRNYIKEIHDDGYELVHKYGIAFMRKDCLVKFSE